MRWIVEGTVLLGFLASLIAFIRLFKKQGEIHVLVNSNMREVLDRLGASQNRESDLKDQLRDERNP